MGNINNVYTAPSRPSQPRTESPAPVAVTPTPAETKPETVGSTNGFIGTAYAAVTSMVEAIAPGTTAQVVATSAAETSKDLATEQVSICQSTDLCFILMSTAIDSNSGRRATKT